MVCKQCGAIIPDSMNRCQRCGAALSAGDGSRRVSAMRQGAPKAESAPASKPQQEPTGNAVQREIGDFSELRNRRHKAAGVSTAHGRNAENGPQDRAARKAVLRAMKEDGRAAKEAFRKAKLAQKKAKLAEEAAVRDDCAAARARRRADTIGGEKLQQEAVRLTRKAAAAMAAAEAKKQAARQLMNEAEDKNAVYTSQKTYNVRRVMINWSHVALILMGLMVIAVIGFYIFLQTSFPGQMMLARWGRECSSDALWAYGQEMVTEGNITRAIELYEKAYQQDPKREDIYSKLQLLTVAYEANQQPDKAEEIYTLMYKQLDKKNPVAYKNIVRLMRAQGRLVECADFLLLAYENTGEATFIRQRTEMLPATPTATLATGKYSTQKTVELQSAEGYDIYYIIGQGELPEEGTLYTEPLRLNEGYHAVRAVAVSSNLISDELAVAYTITLPNPAAPVANVASGTYKTAAVRLRNPNPFDVTIYYTVDGTSPTANSPIYSGEPIVLPGAHSMHLKAVCVDANGKVSNELDVEYEITGPSFRFYFNSGDEFSNFSVMRTTMENFKKKYGEPLEQGEVDDNAIPGICIKLTYSWGEARFYSSEKGYILYYVETASSQMTGPRSTRVGMSMNDLIASFRDMNQAKNQDGTRSLYHDDKAGTGYIYVDDENSYRVEYCYYREDSAVVSLCYYVDSNVVTRITIKCYYPK